MKVFVGRSQSLWVVEPRKGKVTKLPISLTTLIFSTVGAIASVSILLTIMAHTGFSPRTWVDVVKTSVAARDLDIQSEKLHAAIAKLKAQKDEARRLNTKLSSQLEILEGALGSVAGEVMDTSEAIPTLKDKKKANSVVLLKPASFLMHGNIGQRQTIKKIDRIVANLRHLPLKFPVENPIITSLFGARSSPEGFGSSFHHGVDFSLRDSTRVLATGSGVVQTVGYMRGYGLYIDIMHRYNVVTRYAHLAQSLVRAGDRVNTGSRIAVGGSSGSSTGRHLHYEIIFNGRAQDPMQFLKIPSKLQLVLRSRRDVNLG